MSDSDRPEIKALVELEDVVRHVSEELAAWRRRALKAESDRNELGADYDPVGSRERIQSLEVENSDLGGRLDAARVQLQDLLKRLRFLEEQVALEDQAQ